MNDAETKVTADTPPKQRGCLFYGGMTALVILVIVVVTALTTAWWVRRQLNAPPISPVELTMVEQEALDQKLAVLGQAQSNEPRPEKMVRITEKEVNALLAHNTDLGEKVAISLGHDTVSARWNIPLDQDVPMLGGKTLRGKVRVKALLMEDGRMSLRIDDVTVAGISLPNAWLGDIKDVDLVEEYFSQDEVLGTFLAGIEDLRISDGELTLILAE